MASVSGMASGNHRAGTNAEADEADGHNDARSACSSEIMNSPNGIFDECGLVGDERRLDTDREVRGRLGDRALDVAAECEDVAALAHRDRKADGGLVR